MRRAERVGRYHLTERIGYGGMAEIFRAFTYDADGSRRDIAVKRLLLDCIEDPQFVDMLADEFRLASHLHHPSIVEVYELAEVDGQLLIAMEYVDGKDLRSVMDRAKAAGIRLPLPDTCHVMIRALDGLHHAHVARSRAGQPLNIVHRDVSPSNVLVAYDGVVKLCDFGIAKAASSRVRTKVGVIKGKVKYMSPEQAFGQPLDSRSDVFSAGAVLYELATGQAAFQGKRDIDLIHAVREAAPKRPSEVDRSLPASLCKVITNALMRSRSERFQTAREMRDGLVSVLGALCPGYRRTSLSRFMRTLWAAEIERDLRELEEYVADESPSGNFGRNLIADTLGPEAPYQRFGPSPTRTGDSVGLGTNANPIHWVSTEIPKAPTAIARRRPKSATGRGHGSSGSEQ